MLDVLSGSSEEGKVTDFLVHPVTLNADNKMNRQGYAPNARLFCLLGIVMSQAPLVNIKVWLRLQSKKHSFRKKIELWLELTRLKRHKSPQEPA
jgi:hypothetical protein